MTCERQNVTCVMWHNYKYTLLSLHMKTKVVQHVPRTNIIMSQTQTKTHWFPAFVMLTFFDETLTLITFLAVEQMIFYCCQKETYHWKVHVKLDWKMVLGESLTSKIYLLWMLQYWLVPWWDWKKAPNRYKKILYSQFLDNGTKQNIKLWLVLVATYMKIKMT